MNESGAQRLGYLDGLRLVAACAVVAQHLFERFHTPWAKAIIAPAPGVFGVVLFFMISGFVIPFSVRQRLALRSFAIRRIMRIYPVYLTVLALATIAGISGLMPHLAFIPTAGLKAWAANLLLVQDLVSARNFYSVSWTLTIELIWYALFALLLKTSGTRAGDVSAIAAPAAMIALTLASLLIGSRIPLGRPGMIYAAVIGYQTYRFMAGEVSRGYWRSNLIGFLLVTLASNFVAFGIFHHPNITVMQAIGPWTLALLLFAASFALPGLRGQHGLGHPLLVGLGAISYSIYMMHPFAIAIGVHLGSPLLVVPAALALTLLFALVSYTLIEKPGIRAGRALAERARSAPRVAAALS